MTEYGLKANRIKLDKSSEEKIDMANQEFKGRQALTEELETAQVGKFFEAEVNEANEEKVMFKLELETTVEYADRTYNSEHELKRFLATLSEEQLALTEVLVDDGSFVVFYPLPARTARTGSGFHFDTDAPRPTVKSVEVPELVGFEAGQFFPAAQAAASERERAMAVLLASVLL